MISGETDSPVGLQKGPVMGVRFYRTGVAAPGKSSEAMAFAAEIAEYFTATFGVAVTWGVQIGGTYGTVYWFADYDDLAHFEAVNGQQIGDQQYMEKVARGEQLFVAGLGGDTLVWIP